MLLGNTAEYTLFAEDQFPEMLPPGLLPKQLHKANCLLEVPLEEALSACMDCLLPGREAAVL